MQPDRVSTPDPPTEDILCLISSMLIEKSDSYHPVPYSALEMRLSAYSSKICVHIGRSKRGLKGVVASACGEEETMVLCLCSVVKLTGWRALRAPGTLGPNRHVSDLPSVRSIFIHLSQLPSISISISVSFLIFYRFLSYVSFPHVLRSPSGTFSLLSTIFGLRFYIWSNKTDSPVKVLLQRDRDLNKS